MRTRLAHGMARVTVLAMLVFMGAGAAFAGGLKGGTGLHKQSKKWLPWYETGGFLSSEEHRSESNLFAPLWQSSVALLFFQGSGKLFEDDIQEGNFDIGFRKMHRSGWNFGLWGGYDVRDTAIDNIFHQISFGFEALSDRWDVRANGYVAISDPAGAPEQARVLLQGTSIVLIGGQEVPLSGFDGEVGYKVFSTRGGDAGGLKDGPASHGRSHELRVFAGGFYFDDDDAIDEVAGPRARIEWRIDEVFRRMPGSRLTFEGEFQYDDVREDQWEGGVRLRIPFGGGGREARAVTLASLTPQERRMTEGIVRDPDIITVESEAENVFDTLTNVRFDRVATLQGGGPLQQTINANGANSLIILDGGANNGSFTLGPSQTLQGGSSTIQVTGVKSGVTANFTAPGAKPLLVNAQNSAVLTIASNTHVAGLGITGAGAGSGLLANDGIVPTANGVSNIAITDTMLMDLGGSGINLADGHNKVLISGTSVARAGGDDGIDLDNFNSNVTIVNVTVDDVADDGIDLDDNNTNVTIQRAVIRNAGDEGIDFESNNSAIVITDSTVVNPNQAGIEFFNNNSGVTIARNTISNTGLDGVAFLDGNSNVTVSGNTISNTGLDGVFFQDNNSNVTVSGNTISNTGVDGVFFFDNNSNVTVSGNTISNTVDDGVQFESGNSATITGNTLTNIGEDAIDVGGAVANVLSITDNTFAGTIGDDVVEFDGVVDTLLDGSGNQLAPGAIVNGSICELNGGTAGFVGTLQIGAFTFVNGAGCT